MKQLHLFAFLLLLLAGCGKDTTNFKVNTPPETISFGGITATDVNGVEITHDSTDWNFHDHWSQKEKSVFTEAYDTGCLPTFNYGVVLYPNPCGSQLMLHLDRPSSARFAFRIVDRNYNLLYKFDSCYYNNIMLLADSIIQTTDTVRMYYKMIDHGCEFRGHGDLLHM